MRRDYFIDELLVQFDTRSVYVAQGAWAGCTALVARPRPLSGSSNSKMVSEKQNFAFGDKPLFSLVPPSAGMFIWVYTLYFVWTTPRLITLSLA